MPDLSHRPSRYAVASASAATLLVLSVTTFDLRLTSGGELEAAERRTTDLREEVVTLRRRLAEETEPAHGPEDWSEAKVGLPMPEAAAEGGDGEGGPPARRDDPPSEEPDCAAYPYQEAAQAAFDGARRELGALDGDRDGLACEQLRPETEQPTVVAGPPVTITPEALPPLPDVPPALPDTPSKAEILASGRHFGIAAATADERHDVEYLLDRDATITSWFKGWDSGYEADRVIDTWRAGEIPMITWESRPLGREPDDTDYSLPRIIDGSFDDYVREWARAVHELGLPVIIRFDHEMNGNWYRWAEFDVPYGNHEGDYVKAWRHVHDIFEEEGANDEALWVWAPSRVDNLTRFPAIDRYYPGDDYVDWLGMSGYLRPGDSPATFHATYDETLGELRRVAPDVPILLAEIGATESVGEKEAWTKSLFPGLLENPDVVGFVWFNYAITEDRVTNDWRITSSEPVLEAVKEGLADSGYGRDRGASAELVPRVREQSPQ